MNFTWFATSFATDDWLYRVLTFVQMGGVLVLAAGIGPAFAEGDYHVMVFSYVVMRIAMVAQWLRASRNPNPLRTTTRIYAAGIVFTQVFWLLQLTLSGPIHAIALLVLIAAELAIPIAVFVLGIWLIAVRQYADRLVNTVIPAAVVLVLLDPILPIPFALTAIVLALVITVLVVRPAPIPGD
jgi:low temperature requirement protein LtrA